MFQADINACAMQETRPSPSLCTQDPPNWNAMTIPPAGKFRPRCESRGTLAITTTTDCARSENELSVCMRLPVRTRPAEPGSGAPSRHNPPAGVVAHAALSRACCTINSIYPRNAARTRVWCHNCALEGDIPLIIQTLDTDHADLPKFRPYTGGGHGKPGQMVVGPPTNYASRLEVEDEACR